METTDYNKQAQDFLDRFNIGFRATLSDSKPCPWASDVLDRPADPHHYRCILWKHKPVLGPVGPLDPKPKRIMFDFWGSIADAERGQTEVTAYDVLACISGDVHTPETFKDFCGEYGYETDSIKALQSFRRCDRFAKRLREFFTAEEIEALGEIR